MIPKLPTCHQGKREFPGHINYKCSGSQFNRASPVDFDPCREK